MFSLETPKVTYIIQINYTKVKVWENSIKNSNRLKKLMSHIITEYQSAFTKDRLISDNILVAFETLQSIQNYKSTTYGFLALKLDMSKAYDRVDWNFLEQLMRKLGFNDGWIHLIMGCVKIVTYSILVNGEPCGMIQPTRGIR